MPDQTPTDLQLDRYLAGELTGEDLANVASWLHRHPDTALRVRALSRAAMGDVPVADTDAAWRALVVRIEATDELSARRQITMPAAPRRVASRAMWMRVAAVVAVVLTGVTAWRLGGPSAGGGQVTAPLGTDVTATLPDGTRLMLVAGSTVTWPADFGRVTREIRLDGEALFDVVHDTAHTFRVRTRDAVAEDIGTRFVVRAWPELSGVEVAVEEGVVALTDTAHSPSTRGTVLRAGDRGRLLRDGVVAVTPDAELVLTRARGQLAFEDESLRTVLPAIGRRFAIDLRADPALVDRRLTARFASQSLPDVLDALALALNVRVVTAGRTITLLPQSR